MVRTIAEWRVLPANLTLKDVHKRVPTVHDAHGNMRLQWHRTKVLPMINTVPRRP